MKTVTRMWIATIVVGLWLLFIQSAHAFDTRSCHLLSPDDLNPQAIVSPLPEAQLAQLKTTFTTHRSESPTRESSDYSKLSEQTEITAFYHAIFANPGNTVVWNNLGQKLLNNH